MWGFLAQTTMVICAGITRIDTLLISHSVLPELNVENVKKFSLQIAVALTGLTLSLNSLPVMDCDFFFWNFTLHCQSIPELVYHDLHFVY
jgi:hypothetical protein